jgi:hypothetical protein
MRPPRSDPTLRPPEGTASGSASAARRVRSAYGARRAAPKRAAEELHGARVAEHPGGPTPGATHARGGAPRPCGDDSARGAGRSRSAANASRAASASAANVPAAICRWLWVECCGRRVPPNMRAGGCNLGIGALLLEIRDAFQQRIELCLWRVGRTFRKDHARVLACTDEARRGEFTWSDSFL